MALVRTGNQVEFNRESQVESVQACNQVQFKGKSSYHGQINIKSTNKVPNVYFKLSKERTYPALRYQGVALNIFTKYSLLS